MLAVEQKNPQEISTKVYLGTCYVHIVLGIDNHMDEIWTVIGLSSLIASVVTVILGIVRDILVDKYHFKRQSEADYLRTQIQVFSQIYFVLARALKGVGTSHFFKERPTDRFKEINAVMEANTYLLPPKVFSQWLKTITLLDKALDVRDGVEKSQETKTLYTSAWKESHEMLKVIAETANNDLLPRYRNIVGESVGNLPLDLFQDSTS